MFLSSARQFSTGAIVSRRVSPAARHIAESKKINLDTLKGTGKFGLISKGDVLDYLRTAQQTTAPPVATAARQESADVSKPVNSRFRDIPNSNMRKVIAKRLTESKAVVPHFYSEISVSLDPVLRMRKTLQRDFGVSVSVNDAVIKAAALALRDVPEARLRFDAKTQSVQFFASSGGESGIDISVAVATPTGLITPILTSADRRGLSDISLTVKDLAGRARAGKLKPEEYQGGIFSISNLGMFGVSSFSAVINPPQACILAVGAGITRPVPILGPDNLATGAIRQDTVVNVQLSADRRVLSEALAAQYLQAFRDYLAQPLALAL